ncbi:hypothetical protein [Helicobacter ganmani]|uniref:hypothetical protein n=3 Tax=Helicobacteraceae TaxID=72293 RepID=UPI003A85693B
MENFEDYVSEFIGDIEGIVKFELLPTYDNFTKEQRKIILRVIEKKLEEAESEIYESKGDEMKLRIKNSNKVLRLQLGLFNGENDLNIFLTNYGLTESRPFYSEDVAQDYCKRALDFGLIAEIEKDKVRGKE